MMMTPARPRRMDGYIRVSRRMGREGPGYISPDVQRQAIQRWADYRDVEIAAWHIDEDESGGTQNRPGLRACLARIEGGETDGIACWRLNRFARNVAGAIEDVRRIQAVDGHLAFVEEDIDPTGPFGSFILTVLLAVSTLERDNMVSGWKTAKARAVERGAKISPTPFGYKRERDGTLSPHRSEAAIVREAYACAARNGQHAALDYLRAAASTRTWTTSTLRRVLANRSYLGESRNGVTVCKDAHPPLVSRAIWEAAQTEPQGKRRPSAAFPLSGLATCGTCGASMVGGRGGASLRTYRCSASLSTHRGSRCTAPATTVAGNLEEHVRGLLRALWAAPGFVVGGEAPGDLTATEKALHEAEAELETFAADLTARRLLGDRYHPALQARVAAVEEAQTTYRARAAETEVQRRVLPVELIDTQDPAELGELLRGAVDGVIVRRGRGKLKDRVLVIPSGADDAAWVSAPEDVQGGPLKAV